jgi:hypothetical protein
MSDFRPGMKDMNDRADSLVTTSEELSAYKLDLVGVQ